MENRIHWVDYIKAFTIILVAYGHITDGMNNAGIYLSESLLYFTASIPRSFRMPLFFFASGLIFYKLLEKSGPRKVIFSKVDYLIYTYLLWSTVQTSLQILMSSYTNKSLSVHEIFTIWEPKFQFWFIYAMFFTMLIVALIYSKNSKFLQKASLGFALAIYLIQPSLQDSQFSKYIAPYLIFFMLGSECAKVEFKNIFRSNFSIFLTFTIALSFQLIYQTRDFESQLLRFLTSITSIVFITNLMIIISRKPIKFIVLLGHASFSIFIFHMLFGAATRIFLHKIFAIQSPSVHLCLGMIISIIAPTLIYVFVKKYKVPFVFSAPISKFLHKIFPEPKRSFLGRP